MHARSIKTQILRVAAGSIIWAACGVCIVGLIHADEDGGPPVRRGQREEGRGDRNAWKSWGGNLANTHSSYFERRLRPGNVGGLSPQWTFETGGDISATPTVEDDAMYVPDWGGNLFKIDVHTGIAIWSRKISEHTGIASSVSRNSPAIAGGMLILGDQATGTVMALDKYSGNLLWQTLVDSHPAARITSSPIVYRNRVYVGVSSREESLALQPGYRFTFRGSVRALDLASGALVWTTYTVPEGYTGGAVWGTFAVDTRRATLYATTGNNYSIPDAATACLKGVDGVEAQLACLSADDYVDSILSLDLENGRINWGRRLQGADTFIYTCAVAAAQGVPCPDPAGPDYDFGAGPNLFRTTRGGRLVDVVGAGQKSGVYWALNAENGDLLWATQVGPGGLFGGIEWGTATDGRRIYVAIGNDGHVPYTLAPAHTETVTAGSWAALDAGTGAILWQVPATGQDPRKPEFGALALAQVSAANGVVYAGSMSGDMVALDAENGRTLWKFATGGSVLCGPAVVNGTVYWGSGYSRLGIGTPNNKVYAFAVERGRPAAQSEE
jgi:polyvinyl alcohol dehydrogenase (cytochrome)